jgi:hypothetical protein
MSSITNAASLESKTDTKSEVNEEIVKRLDDDDEELDEKTLAEIFEVVLVDSNGNLLTKTTLSRKDARLSSVISHAMSLHTKDSDKNDNVLSFPNTASTVYSFLKCIEYMKHHQGVSVPIIEPGSVPLSERYKWNAPKYIGEFKRHSSNIRDVWQDEWDIEFINKIYDESNRADKLRKVFDSANYFHIKPLMHLVAVRMSSVFRQCAFEAGQLSVEKPEPKALEMLGFKVPDSVSTN